MSTVLTIDGSTVAIGSDREFLAHVRPHAHGGYPNCVVMRRGIAPGSAKPARLNKTIAITVNGTTRFAGDITESEYFHDPRHGWCLEYRGLGIKARLDHIPVTNDADGTDTLRYNLPFEDPAFNPARAGRTVGEILISVLEQPTIRAALAAAGLGNYTSAGTGASADATIASRAVTGIANLVGGTGYTTAPTVYFLSGQNGHTYVTLTKATATATVAAGAVTGISGLSGGAGYMAPPQVLFSPLPSATLSDLAALTIIPNRDVLVSGEKLGAAIETLLKQHHPNHTFWVDWDGTLRFSDTRTYTPQTITLNAAGSRWQMPRLRHSLSECYTRVVGRGQANQAGVWLTESSGDLVRAFEHDSLNNTQAIANWKLSDYQNPGQVSGQALVNITRNSSTNVLTGGTVQYGGWGYPASSSVTITLTGGGGSGGAVHATTDASGVVTAVVLDTAGTGYTSVPTATVNPPGRPGMSDSGTCSCLDANTVRITSATPTATYSADYWDWSTTGKHGTLYLRYSAGAGTTQNSSHVIVANTAKVASGTVDLTVTPPLEILTYDSYSLVGSAAGGSVVWRKWRVNDAAKRALLSYHFNRPTFFANSDGQAGTNVTTAQAKITFTSALSSKPQERTVDFTYDPDSGDILFLAPVVTVFGSEQNLLVGGASTDGIPDDVQVWLALNKGANTAACPADAGSPLAPVYEGRAYTDHGLQRTLYCQLDSWRDPTAAARVQPQMCEILDSVKDTIVEGSVTYEGLFEDALAPGCALNFTGSSYNLPWEDLNLPVMGAELTWSIGPKGTHYQTTIELSTRRAQYSGMDFPIMPSGQHGTLNFTGDFGGAVTGFPQMPLSQGLMQGGGGIEGVGMSPGPSLGSFGLEPPPSMENPT